MCKLSQNDNGVQTCPGVENIVERHSGKDHYIGFVNQNTKSMLTIMLTWLTGVRQRLILLNMSNRLLMRSVKVFRNRGALVIIHEFYD